MITPTTTADEFDDPPNSTCSLREAIRAANVNAPFGGCLGGDADGPDTIQLGNGTYNLTLGGLSTENATATGDLDILSAMAINGLGPSQTTINGNGTFGLFDAGGSGYTWSISNVTLQGGNTTADSPIEKGGRSTTVRT